MSEIGQNLNWGNFGQIYVIQHTCETVQEKYQVFFKIKIFKVILLCIQDEEIQFYWLKWYQNGSCEQVDTIVSNPMGNMSLRALGLFKELEWGLTNMNKCPVNITMMMRPPAVINTNGLLTGWEVTILNMTIEKLNGRPNYLIIDPPSGSRMSELLERTDIYGGFLLNRQLPPNLRKLPSGFLTTVVIVAPYIPHRHFSVVWDIFNFSVWIWFFAGIFYFSFISFLYYKLVMKQTYINAFLKSFRPIPLLWDQNIRESRLQRKHRLVYVFWILHTFLVSTMYRVSLASKVTNHYAETTVKTFSDIRSTDFDIFCREAIHDQLQSSLTDSLSSPEDKNRIKIIPSNVTILEILSRIANQKDAILIELKEIILYEMAKMKREEVKNVWIVSENLFTITTHFMVLQNYHLAPYFELLLGRLTSSGFSRYLKMGFLSNAEKYYDQAFHDISDFRAISLADITDSFILLLIGWVSAFLSFTAELIYSRYRQKQRSGLIFNYLESDFHNVGPKKIKNGSHEIEK